MPQSHEARLRALAKARIVGTSDGERFEGLERLRTSRAAKTRIEQLLADAAFGAIEMHEHVVHEQIRPRAIVECSIALMRTEEIRDVLDVGGLRSRRAPSGAESESQLAPRVP